MFTEQIDNLKHELNQFDIWFIGGLTDNQLNPHAPPFPEDEYPTKARLLEMLKYHEKWHLSSDLDSQLESIALIQFFIDNGYEFGTVPKSYVKAIRFELL